jgi:acetyltransferase-like isoleucine patch superfamily enzyme
MFARIIAGVFALGLRCRTRAFSAFAVSLFGEAGRGIVIIPPFRFANLQNVSVGDGAIIQPYCWIHTLANGEDDSSQKLIIGANVSIGMGATISAAKRIVLEEGVLLARNVYISDHGHAFEDISRPIMDQGIRNVREVRVGAGTWLGQNVCVMPGVQIGKHCVIGANSVVTRSLPDFCVAAGAPARIVRQYDPQTQRWEKRDCALAEKA